jgi:hypothetical protein
MSINQDYVSRRQTILPSSLLNIRAECLIKTYELFPLGGKRNHVLYASSTEMIADRIIEGNVPRMSGMGFAVISDEAINLNIWGDDNPSIVHPTIYVPHRKSDGEYRFEKQQDISRLGAYCVWEARILGHEAEAWLTFLRSPQNDVALNVYLKNRIKGTF